MFIGIFLFAFKPDAIREADNTIRSTFGEPSSTLLNINNMSHWIDSDGISAHNPYSHDCGLIFPRHTGNVVYTDGIVWGGYVYDGQTPQLRVGGSTYFSGLQPGAILGTGTGIPENPEHSGVRIWRVRKDWETADLSAELSEFNWYLSEEDIRSQYQTDRDEWPAVKGAPFDDVNSDGVYNPQTDIPGIPGADQTVWFVANDIYGDAIYGSPPIGLELQVTLWAYDRPDGDPFNDIAFKQIRVIYKGTADTPSGSSVQDMYLSQWSDPDIGEAYDDFAGCDSITEIGYAYNKYRYPPAFGYQLLTGPAVVSPGDTAIVNFAPLYDYRNLPMSSSFYFSTQGADSDPELRAYQGTLEWYNLMQGLRPQTGTRWINPLDNTSTNFPLAGDPVSGEGWIDGLSNNAGDRRLGITSGPFTMALGDTQEIVIALVGGTSDDDDIPHLKSIENMKNKAISIKDILNNQLAVNIITASLVPVFQETGLKASCLLLNPSLSVDGLAWSIEAKPEGSNAILSETAGDSVSITPDIEGIYQVSVALTTVEGYTARASTEIFASADKPPVVDFTLSPETIILGDSVLADASPTYDPEGDAIAYQWSVKSPVGGQGNGNFVLGTLYEDKKIFNMIPTGTGRFTVQLTADDGIFENDTSKIFNVTPKMEHVSQVYAYLDTSWFRTSRYYFHEDKLLMAIEPLNIVRIYTLHEDTISIEKDLPVPDPVRVYQVKDNLLYVGTYGIYSGYWGPGPLNVYTLAPDWELTPVLEDYLPGEDDIFDLHFINKYVYIRDYKALYKTDFTSDPANPQVITQRAYDYPITCYADTARSCFYVRVQDYANPRVEILDTASLARVSDLSLPEGWRTVNTYDTLMFIGFYDSLQIHSISNPLQTRKLTTITPPYAFYWVDYLNYWIRCSGTYIQNNLLAMSAGIGILYYDITDPSNPVLKGYWYGGREVSPAEHNGNHYIMGFDVMGSATDSYFGFNKVHLDFSTGLPEPDFEKIPQNCVLYQNYPNPFNASTRIHFDLPAPCKVSLEIFNCLGQKVGTLINRPLKSGRHMTSFEGSGLASGVYIYRFTTDNGISLTKKMVLIR